MGDLLLSLALQAIDDDGSRQVLEDLVIERGPSLAVTRTCQAYGAPIDVDVTIDDERYMWSIPFESEPAPKESLARALAAVLLFRDWDSDGCGPGSIRPPWLRSSYPWPVVRASLEVDYSSLGGIEIAHGEWLDRVARDLFGLERQAPVPPFFETDAELRARCIARLRSVNPTRFDPDYQLDASGTILPASLTTTGGSGVAQAMLHREMLERIRG